MMNYKKNEKKWIERWKRGKIFEANVKKGAKKYYITTPYPYMSGLLHIGHLFTFARPEILARYKRAKGFNVLFPFGFHCTGTPIMAAAQRVKEKEKAMIGVLLKNGIDKKDINKFADPVEWVLFFPTETEDDLTNMGMTIDWRRKLITTSLNPPYDKFIQWQFLKLKKDNKVGMGKHPVIWCPKCNGPVGDHARAEGEGETPQEFTLLKYKLKDAKEYIVAATLRPETIFGLVNMWVDAELEYVKADVNGEVWVISGECAEKLRDQDKKVKIIGKIKGKELIGKKCIAPVIKKEVMILPSNFCDPTKGTGLVGSVPSDAPDDWMGLHDLYNNEKECKKYNLNVDEVRAIKPIAIINSGELGELLGVDICKKMNVKNQNDREKLEEAKKIVYKKGFYEGVMNKDCGKYEGMNVEKARNLMKEQLIKTKEADVMYEPTAKVVCRCLTTCIVKIVTNQWFIKYGDKEWKKEAHKAIESMVVYPEMIRVQFNYVVDWLNDWACTREFGLGTQLPWDKKWVIESLSDSTIHMAYYPIDIYLQNPEYGIDGEKMTEEFFDYVFLGKGNVNELAKKLKIEKKKLNLIREEFLYWYPFDYRNSAKDLVQNHLTFCVFNHVSIFPKQHWPRSFDINGRIMVNNEKMSKSKGNFFTIRELNDKYDADSLRITSINAGEGLDDANFEMDFIGIARKKLDGWYEFATSSYGKGRSDMLAIDKWFESAYNKCIKMAGGCMDKMLFKSGLNYGFFEMQRILKWYLRRANGAPNKRLINDFIEKQTILLSIFAPFTCEEIWEKIGKRQYVSIQRWPAVNEKIIDKKMDKMEVLVKQTMDDINSIKEIARKDKIKEVDVYLSATWKYGAYKIALKNKEQPQTIIKKLMEDEQIRKKGSEAVKYAQILTKNARSLNEILDKHDELKAMMDAKKFLENEFKCKINILDADKSKAEKANRAEPNKPGIEIL